MSFNKYWRESVPWSFKDEKLTYEQRRKLRYDLQDYMEDAIPFKKWSGKQVIEIGCGTGIDSAEFARNGAIVTSVDFAEESVKRTSETFREAGLTGTVLMRSANATGLPDKSFDAAYSFGVLHHIPDVDGALREITRVLKPGGEGVFMVYNKDSLLNAYSILYLHRGEGSEEELATNYSERRAGNPYTKLYTAEEALEQFHKYFSEVGIETFFSAIDTKTQRKVKIDAPKELGWHHIVYCRNPV
jgi:ubiquinone/menaquinone biosynthesis C-methylase UbiE